MTHSFETARDAANTIFSWAQHDTSVDGSEITLKEIQAAIAMREAGYDTNGDLTVAQRSYLAADGNYGVRDSMVRAEVESLSGLYRRVLLNNPRIDLSLEAQNYVLELIGEAPISPIDPPIVAMYGIAIWDAVESIRDGGHATEAEASAAIYSLNETIKAAESAIAATEVDTSTAAVAFASAQPQAAGGRIAATAAAVAQDPGALQELKDALAGAKLLASEIRAAHAFAEPEAWNAATPGEV